MEKHELALLGLVVIAEHQLILVGDMGPMPDPKSDQVLYAYYVNRSRVGREASTAA